MKTYRVFQILLSEAVIMTVNGGGSHPTFDAFNRAMMGDVNQALENWDLYEYVADIEAEDLEGVFEVGNIGPEERIYRRGDKMQSVSVGNVIIEPDGRRFMVAPCGFHPVVRSEDV